MEQKKKGYTASQNIIILGIIFIVSFVLISVPMYNLAKQKAISSQLKSINAIIKQAESAYLNTNSEPVGIYDTTLSPKDFAQKYFTPYIKYEKICEGTNICWNNPTYLDLTNKSTHIDIPYSLVLPQKVVMGFYKSKNKHLNIIIDINGQVGENKLGKDIFVYSIFNNKTDKITCDKISANITDGIHIGGFDECGVPHDTHNYLELFSKDLSDGCNKKAQKSELGAGAACATLIKESNWNIDKVYPW